MTKSNADKQREYRARKKAERDAAGPEPMTVESIKRTAAETAAKERSRVRASTPAEIAAMVGGWNEHTEDGPNSNYYSDPHAPGGWGETIRNMSNEQANHILDRIVTKRQVR